MKWKWLLAGAGLGGAALIFGGGDDSSSSSGGSSGGGGPVPDKGQPVPNPGWDLLPRGKGIFVYDLDDADGPKNLADRLEWLDMDWVMLQTHRIEDGNLRYTDTRQKLTEHIAAVRERGIAVGFWGWPEPERAAEFADVAGQVIAEHAPAGYVVNAEKPWKSSSGAFNDDALEMMNAIRDYLGPDRGLGFTSYGGGPPYHPNFPWAQFALFSDFGVPQIYDMKNNLAEDYPQNSVKWWSEFFAAVVPAWSAGASKTPEMMRDIQDRTPLPDQAACWWSFRSAILSAPRARAVREYSLERAVS